MKKFSVAYVPIGVPTFHLESAEIEFEKSKKLLSSLTDNCVFPEKMLLDIPSLESFLEQLNPSLIVVQNITFANAAYITEVLKRFSTVPVVLWTLKEPVVDGGRLRLNSLTGAYSAANTLHAFGRSNFNYIFGSPEEKDVEDFLTACISAVKLKEKLHGAKIAAVGQTPQGFGFGRELDSRLAAEFGINLVSVEARELIDIAKSYDNSEINEYLEKAKSAICGLDSIDEKNVLDFAKLYKAYDCFVKENNIAALSSRCWPDFFTAYGTPVCAVLSIISNMGVPCSCEADVLGSVTMLLAAEFSQQAVFFGDPVSMDEKENTITYWHCGSGACSLASKNANADVHCNRKIGPTLDFSCKPSDSVTVLRIGRKADGALRIFLTTGSAPDVAKQFIGTSIVVKTSTNAKAVIDNSVQDGWEPHFVVAYGDLSQKVKIFTKMMNIELCEY